MSGIEHQPFATNRRRNTAPQSTFEGDSVQRRADDEAASKQRQPL